MSPLPEALQKVLDKYAAPLGRMNLTSRDVGHIIEAMQSNYAYGVAVGLALASVYENKPMITRYPTGDDGNPIVNEVINAAAPYEAEFAQFFKEALNL